MKLKHTPPAIGWILYQFHPRLRSATTWEYVTGPARTAAFDAYQRGGSAGFTAYFDRYQVDLLVLSNGI